MTVVEWSTRVRMQARAAQTQINIRHQLRNNDMYPSSLDEAVAAACGYVGYKEGLSAIQRVNNDPAASVDYRALIGQPKVRHSAAHCPPDRAAHLVTAVGEAHLKGAHLFMHKSAAELVSVQEAAMQAGSPV